SDNPYSLDQDDDILASHSQSPQSFTNKSIESYSVKRVKLTANKDYFIKNFFESYKKPGIRSKDKSITKFKYKVADCKTKYIWHGSTTNMLKHLHDIHHITKTLLENKIAKELKKSPQQTLEKVLILDEFDIYDLTLGVIELGMYKTANDIVESIKPMLEEFDNSTNVKAAITKLSTSLQVSKPIANIFCAIHTLQLSVNVDLEVADNLINKCKMLISLMTFERFVKLERPIKWLTNDLENSTNTDYHRDSANIHKKLLSNDKFKTVKALVNLLHLFYKATKILSGSTYTILSIIVPMIKELVYRLNNTNSELDIINEFNELSGRINQVECDKTNLSQVAQAKKEKKLAMKKFFSSIQ
ncbi:40250_t:CDS:2, partial [Gigaspora margarita]